MTVRGGLGKGLGALIPSGARALQEIPASDIVPNPKQPRRHFDEEALATLAASIRRLGLLQPVVVRRNETGTFELVMGERRWRASQRAGLANIPALVIETDDRGALERALVENIHREDLNPIEEAASYRQLLDEAGLTHDQLAERVGLSRPSISNAIRLLELPDSIQKLVIQGKLSAGHARSLLGLTGHPLLERIAQKVAGSGLSVRQTEELVRRQASESELPGRPAKAPPPGNAQLLEAAERLGEALQTRVKVAKGKGKGKIIIEFGSLEDLDRLLTAIAGEESGSYGASVEP
ncbi:MAG: ParB/RepB/Spo0J family partition protein [Actinomycetota bacterium]